MSRRFAGVNHEDCLAVIVVKGATHCKKYWKHEIFSLIRSCYCTGNGRDMKLANAERGIKALPMLPG